MCNEIQKQIFAPNLVAADELNSLCPATRLDEADVLKYGAAMDQTHGGEHLNFTVFVDLSQLLALNGFSMTVRDAVMDSIQIFVIEKRFD